MSLKKSQAVVNWAKICETHGADMHTLVKFFRTRIPCSCLDWTYQEVKSITKMAFCQYKFPNGLVVLVELSKTIYCSRYRNVTYCSRECQKAGWTKYKPDCDKYAAKIATFEEKKQE